MAGLLTIISLIVCSLIVVTVPAFVSPWGAELGVSTVFDTGRAVMLCAFFATVAGLIINRQTDSREFLLNLFIAGLLVRVLLGTAIFVYQGQQFFGGDALTYDFLGYTQLRAWYGEAIYWGNIRSFEFRGAGGWGMIYLVAAIYGVVGRNALAIQFFNAVLGAATAVLIYLCAYEVFNNIRVARVSALAVAFFPSLVLWSSQGLKDGPIVFLLAVAILMTLKLRHKFDLKLLGILVVSMFAVLSLRFYVFYMITAAVIGALLLGVGKFSAIALIRQFALVIAIGLALTYMGVIRYADMQVAHFSDLERIQRSRLDAATSARSGFSAESDVSTSEGALQTIPVGLLYLLFAPFPWQLGSLRQSITLPEMVVWWACFPLLILGLWFSIRYRLRQISPILIFTVMLSLAYSIFQGNVGNAYRQRSQLLIFYFIFVAVGYVLLSEKREERKRLELMEPEPLQPRIATSILPRR